ncbi:MAG: PD-(D/E)XK nuclease family protein, partial [Alphaproteobacteria bacterium]|nr:PD-(D/E)XK nuclease family protein [Alphaproteobacteria bacterium]
AVLALQLAIDAVNQNKNVLIVTPDKAVNQRIRAEVDNYNAQSENKIAVDFSAGVPGNMTKLGRAILNLMDDFINDKDSPFDKLLQEYDFDLYELLVDFMENYYDKGYKYYEIRPSISYENKDDFPIWQSIKNMSDVLKNFCKELSDVGIYLTVYDIRAFLDDAIKTVSVRYPCPKDCKISVLGTIEARMQTADVVILTGLNEDMFPALGYKSFWISKSAAEKIGMPSPNKKVSLMSLDFMTLSCAPKVYWLRTTQSGGSVNLESRFISRVRVYCDKVDSDDKLLELVNNRDVVKDDPIKDSAIPKDVDTSDVFVTELETLINNPYNFYVKHILRLKPQDDYWIIPDQRNFGNIIHDVIENHLGKSKEELVALMDEQVKDVEKEYPVLFKFWHERFEEIAKYVSGLAEGDKGNIMKAEIEREGHVELEFEGGKRTIRAKADIVWPEGVMDIKTGAIPEDKDLESGDKPQIPLEGYILQNNGFDGIESDTTKIPVLQFLQLKKNSRRIVSFTGEEAENIIQGSVNRIKALFAEYAKAGVEYEYINQEDPKSFYTDCDDFARHEN